jgi:hypothetical protein
LYGHAKTPPPPSLAQAADVTGGPYPTMVAEEILVIQIVLIIKIFGVRTDPSTNTSTIALIAALYLRTSLTPLIPTSVISFGTANPDQNIVNYILDTSGMSRIL